MSEVLSSKDVPYHESVPYALDIANSCAEDQTHRHVWAKVAKILAVEVRRLTPETKVATVLTAAKITELTTKFPNLGIDTFVHERDYNQAENGRMAREQQIQRLRAEVLKLESHIVDNAQESAQGETGCDALVASREMLNRFAPSDDGLGKAEIAAANRLRRVLDGSPARQQAIAAQDYPALSAFHEKHALTSLTRPSCLVCGKTPEDWPPAIRHMELPNVVVCAPCANAARSTAETTGPQLEWEVTYDVVAYNESWGGYGDSASKSGFRTAEEAINYAKPLGAHLAAVVWKRTKPMPVAPPPSEKIWSAVKATCIGGVTKQEPLT